MNTIDKTGAATKRLILALDVMSAHEALAWVRRLKGRIGVFKVGLRLFVTEGPEFVRRLRGENVDIFLDLKLHDIPSTVEATMRAVASLDVAMATIHATGGHAMIQAAATGAAAGASSGSTSGTQVLAVTMLTSISEAEQQHIFGGADQVENRVLNWANMALGAGADGIVASALEAKALKLYTGDTVKNREPLIVTPGIRRRMNALPGTRGDASPGAVSHGDQSRIAEPGEAIRAGATHLVVGRPILEAADPEAEVDAILAEISAASLS